jgi:hypothetical protein
MWSFKKSSKLIIVILAVMAFSGLSCSLLSNLGASPPTDATPTPTEMPGGNVTPADPDHPCAGVSGTLSLQLLIGPSEAVGLEPYTFADIPFQVALEGNSYLVEGGGPIEYYEDILVADWGSFSVTFDGVTAVSGICLETNNGATLDVLIEMNGQQTVVVVVEGAETTYPWEGSPSISASLPLVDGAQMAGEGWNLVLHLR